MKLFTKEIDTKLFEQYLTGSDLENQMVVAKIFNPYGRGTWYLLNSDPEDPEYLWAIVDMDDIEVGSVNRSDLENIRIKPFMLGLERDLSFRQMNALELYEGLNEGKKYIKGGGVEKANFGYLLIADKMKNLAPKSFDAVDEKFAERIKIGMYADGGEVEEINQVKIEIEPQYYDEKDNRKNVALKYDVNYLITFNNKDFIELTGTLKPYHTGRDYDYEFEVDYFADQKEEDYYEKNSEKIKNEILDKFYSKKATGGGVGITESDIIEGVSFKNKSGTIFVIDKIELDPKFGKLVISSLLGGKKGNYRDEITDFIAFLNKEKVVKYETGGGVEEKWQIKDSNDKYFSVSMQTGNPVWNESPDLGYSYKKQEAEKIKDKLVELGTKDLKVVEYNPNWWKMKTGGGVEKSVLHLYKLTYPNGQYIVEDYNGGSMTPKEALEKMRISLRGFKSYKYASASSDSDNYKKWHTKKSIGYSNTEAWDEVFGKEKYEKGGGVDSIKITKNEFQFRKDEPKRVYHSYEGTIGDYIFYAETDNSFKSGYGSYGINKGSIYKLSIRKVLDNGMHDSIAEYWNKWDYRTKNAKDGAIRSKIIKYIDSISDEKKGTPKKYKQGGEVGSKLTGWKHKKK